MSVIEQVGYGILFHLRFFFSPRPRLLLVMQAGFDFFFVALVVEGEEAVEEVRRADSLRV